MENADSDLTMDMVRILLAKIQDESNTSPDKYPKFWITAKQYASEDGKNRLRKRSVLFFANMLIPIRMCLTLMKIYP